MIVIVSIRREEEKFALKFWAFDHRLFGLEPFQNLMDQRLSAVNEDVSFLELLGYDASTEFLRLIAPLVAHFCVREQHRDKAVAPLRLKLPSLCRKLLQKSEAL